MQDGAVRMRWRDQTLFNNQPQVMETEKISISLLYTSYIVQPGNELRVSCITSSNFPRFSVNPNKGEGLVGEGGKGPVIAENVMYHSDIYHSQLIFPVVELQDV